MVELVRIKTTIRKKYQQKKTFLMLTAIWGQNLNMVIFLTHIYRILFCYFTVEAIFHILMLHY